MNRRKFIITTSIASASFFVPIRKTKANVALYCIAGGILIGILIYMGWKICKLAHDKLNPPPSAPPPPPVPTNTPPHYPYPTNTPSRTTHIAPSFQEVPILASDVSSNGWTHPDDGSLLMTYCRTTFQRSIDGAQTWTDYPFELWGNDHLAIVKFGEKVWGFSDLQNIVTPVDPAITGSELWRVKS